MSICVCVLRAGERGGTRSSLTGGLCRGDSQGLIKKPHVCLIEILAEESLKSFEQGRLEF